MNVLLIGYHGSGKTVVGRKLADVLWREFVDVDDRLAQAQGTPVTTSSQLQDAGRHEQILTELSGKDELIIAASSTPVPSPAALDVFRRNGKVLYLQAPAALLAQRIAGSSAADIAKALAELDPLYRAAADVTLETAPMDISTVVRLAIRTMG